MNGIDRFTAEGIAGPMNLGRATEESILEALLFDGRLSTLIRRGVGSIQPFNVPQYQTEKSSLHLNTCYYSRLLSILWCILKLLEFPRIRIISTFCDGKLFPLLI